MLFLVIERFRGGDPRPVYQRFAERGRMAPAGVQYVNSWTTADLRQCFQEMDCESRSALDEWISRWHDLVDFEVFDVMTSAEAAVAVAARPTARG